VTSGVDADDDDDFTGHGPFAPGHSQSLVHGLTILACFTPAHPVLGVTDIAGEVGLLPQTTHRYLSTLVLLGYLQKENNHKYRATLAVTRLGLSALAATKLHDHAHRYVEELCKRSSFTISLSVLDGPEILYHDRVGSTKHRDGQDEKSLGIESRLPAHCTAMGKLLLAYCPKTEQSRHLREIKLTAKTSNTITSKPALRKALAHIRAEGFAVNDQESASGTHAIAVPIHSANCEVVAALSMTAPITAISLANLIKHFKPYLLVTADRISGRLGYRR
jgi:IclR family pca regulon transcriptional regulator